MQGAVTFSEIWWEWRGEYRVSSIWWVSWEDRVRGIFSVSLLGLWRPADLYTTEVSWCVMGKLSKIRSCWFVLMGYAGEGTCKVVGGSALKLEQDGAYECSLHLSTWSLRASNGWIHKKSPEEPGVCLQRITFWRFWSNLFGLQCGPGEFKKKTKTLQVSLDVETLTWSERREWRPELWGVLTCSRWVGEDWRECELIIRGLVLASLG